MTDRGLVRMALPSKGRMAEPSVKLLHDAGIAFEPNGRTLHTRCLDLDLELLFVRSDDIPVWTRDGGVDAGITGRNQAVEAGVALDELLALDFGYCRLALAVPHEHRAMRPEDLAGARIATSYGHTLALALDRLGIEARILPISGSVELAPRLHAADAVADLVSSGETLRQNGLREIGTLLESQAVLVARRASTPPSARSSTRSSCCSARSRRPPQALPDAECARRVAGRRARPAAVLDAPTVLPLSRPGMHAVHAVIDADEVVRLLGPLRAAGASSLLVMPIEHLIP